MISFALVRLLLLLSILVLLQLVVRVSLLPRVPRLGLSRLRRDRGLRARVEWRLARRHLGHLRPLPRLQLPMLLLVFRSQVLGLWGLLLRVYTFISLFKSNVW